MTQRTPFEEFHRERWQAWRVVLDRAIRHGSYRADVPNKDPRKVLVMKLQTFATSMMGKHNTAYWKSMNLMGPTTASKV